MKKSRLLCFLILIVISEGCSQAQKSENSPNSKVFPFAVQQNSETRNQYEAIGKSFVISTQGVASTKAAAQMFHQGGNIIDAAVAASFAISVERPHSTGIGGGGFLIYREAKTQKVYAIDFRERAPLKATEKMFLNSGGEVIPKLSTDGILAAGTPGMVAGVLEIHKRFGKLSRLQVMAPAQLLAENGFAVYKDLAAAILERKSILSQYPASAKIFLKANEEPYRLGDILVQKDLAQTLGKISKQGAEVFYRGEIARAIVKESKSQKGILSLQDLNKYKVKWREPVKGSFHGFDIYSMPPPSSGGTHVVEILNILEHDALGTMGYGSVDAIHLEASAMQQAFADRASFMGDPEFLKSIPLKGLLSKSYAEVIRKNISLEHSKKINEVGAGNPQKYESLETTNFSILDSEGNMVVSTQTINGWMGSGLVVSGTGILLNNEMDDFSAKPGASNLYGAVGSTANAIAPLKTPLSSMAPTIILKNQLPVLGLGAPGGTRIITCVAQTILNYLDFKLPLYESISYLRIHHQWSPDQIVLESPGFSKLVQQGLQEKGYKVLVSDIGCRVNAVANETANLKGVADPRDLGASYGE